MERVKTIFCNPAICLLPTVFLMFTSKSNIFAAPMIYIFCIIILKNKEKWNIHLKKNPFMFVPAFVISCFLGRNFFKRWCNSLVLDNLLLRFEIKNSEHFILCISILLSILSVWGGYIFVYSYYQIAKRDKGRYDYNSDSTTETKIKASDLLMAAGMAIFVGIFITFRPLSNYILKIDESVFMYIGKQMVNGFVPYRDLFDHKGIILYFFNYIGFLISDKSFWGIWLVCILNAFVYALIQIRILKMITNSKIVIFLSEFVIVALFAVRLGNSANMAEGFALPWISLTLYICLKYFVKNIYKLYEIALIGVSFAVLFFLRCNMMGVFVLLPVILVIMIIRKNSIDILKCTAAFLLGALVICIPLFIYFEKTDSLSYMIKYYLEFNFTYSGDSASFVTNVCVMLSLMEDLIIPFTILFSFPLFYRNKVYILNFVVFFASLVLASMSGRNYSHYAVVMLPMCSIFLCYFMEVIKSEIPEKVRWIETHQLFYVGSALLVILFVCIEKPITMTSYANANEIDEYILTNTSENDDVLIIGNRVAHYLYTNRHTLNKFFYQAPPVDVSDVIYKDFLDEFNENKSDFVIFERYKLEESKMLDFWTYLNSLETYVRYDYDSFSVFRRVSSLTPMQST